MTENILTLKDKKEIEELNTIIDTKQEEILFKKNELYSAKCKILLKKHKLEIGDVVTIKGTKYIVTYAPWFGIETENSFNSLALAPMRIKYNEPDNRFVYLNRNNLKNAVKTYEKYKGKIFCYINSIHRYGERRDIHGNVCSKKIRR